MSAELAKQSNKLPTLSELISDVGLAWQNDQLNLLLSQQPPANWVKQHPYIKNYNYLPIDKIEYLLRKIFKKYKIEVLKTGLLLNAVEVTVRVHYLDPITNEMLFHDGVGAQELQTVKDSGSLKLDMSNINKGAIMMALPIAKSVAVKDACDHFGDLFGANLNRKDTLVFSVDKSLDVDTKHEELSALFEEKKDQIPAVDFKEIEDTITNKKTKAYQRMINYLQKL